MLTSRGLGRVLGDLASMGFDARWGVLGAADVGANHQRDRIWIVAKWRGQLPHAQHDRIGRWEQQQKSIEKKANDSYPNLLHDALRGNCQDYEKSVGKWGIYVNRSLGNSWQRCEEVTRESFSVANSSEIRPCGKETKQGMAREFRFAKCGVDRDWWKREPDYVPRTTERNLGRVADGVAARVDRLKSIGNGQVPLCAATAWRILSQ